MSQMETRILPLGLLWVASACALLHGQTPTQPQSRDTQTTQQNDKLWTDLVQAAHESLKRASECAGLQEQTVRCSQEQFLDEAATRYREMASLLAVSAAGAPDKVVMVANGLLKSGRASEAIAFLSQQDVKRDGSLQRLLADIYFSIGEYRNAGIAYKNWIAGGCKGYLFFSLDDLRPWAARLDMGRCSVLPAELRARLEHLRSIAQGEPSNLPEKNEPAVPAADHLTWNAWDGPK